MRALSFWLCFECLFGLGVAHADVQHLSANDLRRMQLTRHQGLVIIDARPAPQFAASHIQGARHLTPHAAQAAGVASDAPIVVYCGEAACPLSAQAARQLEAAGYQHVSILEGGLNEWLKHHYPAAPVLCDA